jgi:ABC-type transport system involved in multi-copper enzyme maturation permease subunit
VSGIFTVFRKELEDYFSSTRFLIIFALIAMVGVIIASMVGMTLQEETRGIFHLSSSLVFSGPSLELFWGLMRSIEKGCRER